MSAITLDHIERPAKAVVTARLTVPLGDKFKALNPSAHYTPVTEITPNYSRMALVATTNIAGLKTQQHYILSDDFPRGQALALMKRAMSEAAGEDLGPNPKAWGAMWNDENATAKDFCAPMRPEVDPVVVTYCDAEHPCVLDSENNTVSFTVIMAATGTRMKRYIKTLDNKFAIDMRGVSA